MHKPPTGRMRASCVKGLHVARLQRPHQVEENFLGHPHLELQLLAPGERSRWPHHRLHRMEQGGAEPVLRHLDVLDDLRHPAGLLRTLRPAPPPMFLALRFRPRSCGGGGGVVRLRGGGVQAGSGRGNFYPCNDVANSGCANNGGADANTRIRRGAHRRSVEDSTTSCRLCCASASTATGVGTNQPTLVRWRPEVGVRAEENLPLPSRLLPERILRTAAAKAAWLGTQTRVSLNTDAGLQTRFGLNTKTCSGVQRRHGILIVLYIVCMYVSS